ncbi:hypothetical protein [Kineothrix alysoides]|uniref:hypothetical protein n=1 Tax=Kineothrix alysoides TaxID=1469948 RepID=UPI000AA2B102|nr:hypothetical protein [Kineothrix alysoides]
MIKFNPADRIERPQKNVFVPDYYNAQKLDLLFKAVKAQWSYWLLFTVCGVVKPLE